MPYKIDIHEFNETTGLAGSQRYAYFLVRVAECQEVWTLAGPEGLVTVGDGAGNVCIPVWPHQDFASALAVSQWSHCRAERVNVVDFMQKWAQGMEKAGYFYAVFPTLNNTGVVVAPDRLRCDLLAVIKEQKEKQQN